MFNWRRVLILSHRYLGIGISLVFVLWFASGFVIIYTGGMPSHSEFERLSHQPPLNLAQVRITPRRAQSISTASVEPTLRMIMDRPAYQFIQFTRFAGRQVHTVFADDGSVLTPGMISSRQIAADYYDVTDDQIERVATVDEVDQWTIGLRGELPLEKFRLLDDDSATEIYVSPKKAQVVLSTTATERRLAWLGAIPHWLYFVELRKRSELWSGVVIWLSSLGTLLALLGLILFFTQLRRVRPFSLGEAIPYTGLMRWHYISGMLFGVITLTWVFSGLLSMDPYNWTSSRGLELSPDVLRGGEVELLAFSNLNTAESQSRIQQSLNGRELTEIGFTRRQGEHYYQLTVAPDSSNEGFEKLQLDAQTLQIRSQLFSQDYMVQGLQAAASGHRLISQELLTDYDDYYYSRSSANRAPAPLPVLRVKFNDPASTWYYVDFNTSELVFRTHRLGRIKRWLYHGLHSLDFSFWYQRRPLWDIAVIVLLLGGLVLCGLGCFLGFRRLLHR